MHSLPKKIREMEAVADDLVNRSTQEEDPVDTKRLSSDADKRKSGEDRRLRAAAEEKKPKEDKDLCECASRADEEADKLRDEEKKKKKPDKKGKQPQHKVKAPEAKAKEEAMKQQGQAAKRPQTPAPPTQPRYPPREVPPRFMIQAAQKQSKNKQKGQNELEFSGGWGDMNGGGSGWDKLVVDDRDRDSWPSIGGEVANCSVDGAWGATGSTTEAVSSCSDVGSAPNNSCGHGHCTTGIGCGDGGAGGSGCDVTPCASLATSSSSSSASSVSAAGAASSGCVSGGGSGGAVSSSGNAMASGSGAGMATTLTSATAGLGNVAANAGGSCGSVITSSSPAVEGQWPSEASNGNGSSTSQGQGSNATLLLASHLCSGSSSSNTCSNSCSASSSPSAATAAAINVAGGRGGHPAPAAPQAPPMDVWGSPASNLYHTLNSQAGSGNNNNAAASAAAASQGDPAAHQEQSSGWGSRAMQESGGGGGQDMAATAGNGSVEWRDANPQAQAMAAAAQAQNGDNQAPGANPNQSEGHVWGVAVVGNSNCSVAGGGLLNDNGTSGWGNGSTAASGAGARNGANDGWGASQGQWGSAASSARICAAAPNNCGQGVNGGKTKGTWAQAACKGLSSSNSSDNSGSCNVNSNMNNSSNNNNGNGNMVVVSGHQGTEASAKKVDECDPRTTLTSHDGWGLGGVNQDTAWDVPGTQEPVAAVLKDPTAPTVIRSTISNGTEIWENSLRNGKGNPSGGGNGNNPTVQQPPWGSNPTTNIGGMWGEDEDTSNVWTGMPAGSNNNNSGNGPNNNGPNMHSNNSGGTAMWGTSPGVPSNERKDKWGNSAPAPATGWGDANGSSYNNGASSWPSPAMAKPPQGPPAPAGHPGMGPAPATPNGATGHHGGPGMVRMPGGGGVAPVVGPKEVKPTGWEEPSPPTPRRGVPNYDDGTSVWGNPHSQGKNQAPPPSVGSAGVIRIPTGNAGLKGDPGTAIWGKPPTNSSQCVRIDRSASWNDGGPHDSMGSSGWDDGSMNAAKGNGVGSAGGNGSGSGGWGDPGSPHSWSSKPKTSNWGDGQVVDTSTWGAPSTKQGGKLLTKDLIWASRPFRILCDLGYKKEDVENALRNNNMNFDDAMSDLGGNNSSSRDNNLDGHDGFGAIHTKLRPGDDEMNSIDNNAFNPNMVNVTNAHLYPGPVAQPRPFKSQGVGINSLSGHHGNANANSAQMPNLNLAPGAGNLNPSMIQKFLLYKQHQQQVPQFQNLGQSFGSQDRVNQQSIPSTAQLRLIVQQIQTAVQAGHLNPQILNQPMAPQTLLLVNQLLQQIKHLQQLTTEQQLAQQHQGKGSANTALQLSVQITKTKQQITNLQNQITVQQAVFSKQQQMLQQQQQQQQQQQAMANDFLKPTLDPLALIQSGVQELTLKEPTPTTPTQQSRLHQWKLPSIDKDLEHPASPNSGPPAPLPMQPMTHSHAVSVNPVGVGDFSRAPGSVAKPTSLPQPLPSSLNTLFSQVDNTWTLTRSQSESGWPDSASVVGPGGSVVSVGDSSVNGDKESQWSLSSSLTPSSNQPSYNIGDLVAEFEPGKPWKGVPSKNIEDDPHITPGSVARSPLNSIKESDIFNSLNKSSSVSSASDSTYPPLSITNTWSFNSGTTASSPSYSSPGSIGSNPGSFQKKWPSEPHQHPHPPSQLTSELWGPPVSKSRWQPPPGMGATPGGMKVMGGAGGLPVGPSGGLGSNAANSSPSNSWGPPVGSARIGWNPDGRNSFPPVPSSGWDRQATSTWLMLRNLTPQIDGSTLKTLCMQHGPLVAFHLYLNQGIALVRYSSREEASKAQNALNSCVLGNTTIFADFANENDMNQFLQQSGHAMNATRSLANNTWGGPLPNSNSVAGGTSTVSSRGSGGGSQHQGSSATGFKGGDAMAGSHWNGASLNMHTSALWSMSSGSLWGSPNASEHDQHRATPSSLNSFLPGDLLGGESV